MRAALTFMRARGAVPRPADGTLLLMAQFAAYVGLLALAAVAQSGLLKALANVYAVVIFALVAFAWMTRQHPPSRWASAVALCWGLYMVGIACSLVVNPRDLPWGDLVKLSLAPAFLIFGAAFERARHAPPAGQASAPVPWQRPVVRVLFGALVLVPLLAWAAQLVQSGFQVDGVRETSIFANRNNAAVYAVTLLGLYTALSGRPVRSLLAFLAVGVMFGTLGVLLAVLLALALTVARVRELLLLAVLVALGAGGYLLFPDLGPYVRVRPLVDSVRLLLEGRLNLHTVSFGELVLMLNTSDLSFLFRLKHWVDLVYLYAQGDVYQLLFGHGAASATRLSEMRLVPHNDYLRVLFEFGAVTLAGFVGMLALILARCGRRWETVPLLVVVIYLFSENLVTNFTAIAFFYFTAGTLAERIATQRPAAPPEPARQPRARSMIPAWGASR